MNGIPAKASIDLSFSLVWDAPDSWLLQPGNPPPWHADFWMKADCDVVSP